MLDLLGGLRKKSWSVTGRVTYTRRQSYGVGLLFPLLRTTTEAKDEMEGGLLLDVVVGKVATILKLFASEDQALLVGGDPKRTRSVSNWTGSSETHPSLS